jgi:hypothetical protein
VARDDERIDDSSEIVGSGEVQQHDRPGISIDPDLGDARACEAGEVCRIIKRRLVEAGFDHIDRIIVRHICGQGDLRERHGPVGARDGKLAVFELDVALEYQTKDRPSATVCAHNPLGAKGCGEAGTIGPPAAIMNAVINALAPLGVTDLAMPATPGRV